MQSIYHLQLISPPPAPFRWTPAPLSFPCRAWWRLGPKACLLGGSVYWINTFLLTPILFSIFYMNLEYIKSAWYKEISFTFIMLLIYGALDHLVQQVGGYNNVNNINDKQQTLPSREVVSTVYWLFIGRSWCKKGKAVEFNIEPEWTPATPSGGEKNLPGIYFG